MARDFKTRPTVNGVDVRIATDPGGASDHIINLDTDSRLFTDGPSEFPEGLSVMYSEDADLTGSFTEQWEQGRVQTIRTGIYAVQTYLNDSYGFPQIAWRVWSDSISEWSNLEVVNDWNDFANKPSTFPPSTHASSHTNGTDDVQSATASQKGLMTSAYASKLDGIESGATADQTAAEILTAIKTVDGSGSGLDADLLDGSSSAAFAAASHAATHTNGTDDVQSATASQKGLMTSAYASKLDGIESGATADQTASEILTAIKTVDGSGSGLDADLLDGNSSAAFATATGLSDHLADTSDAHDASAISYAGGTGMSATDVEAAVDELATEKANDADLTAHINDTTDAHDASAVSVLDTGNNFTGTNVEAVLAELDGRVGLTEVEKDFGTTLKKAGHFQVTGLSGLTTNNPVVIHQLAGPYTGKGTQMDEAEMDNLTVVGRVLNSTTIQCYWRCDTFVRGNFKFGYAASA